MSSHQCHSGKGSGETTKGRKGLPLQEDHSHHSRVAQHALVLEFGSQVKLYPSAPAGQLLI